MEATIIRYKVLPFIEPFFYDGDYLTYYKWNIEKWSQKKEETTMITT